MRLLGLGRLTDAVEANTVAVNELSSCIIGLVDRLNQTVTSEPELHGGQPQKQHFEPLTRHVPWREAKAKLERKYSKHAPTDAPGDETLEYWRKKSGDLERKLQELSIGKR